MLTYFIASTVPNKLSDTVLLAMWFIFCMVGLWAGCCGPTGVISFPQIYVTCDR